MGQLQTHPSNQTTRAYQTTRKQQIYNKRIQHQGLLKLRGVPFKDCLEIQSEVGPLFIQNIEITLKDLLQTRLYTNKLFPKQDVQRLIQNVTYTLAYLQENKIPYKDISAQNIFYDEGTFKLLPNQLIPESRYKKFLSSAFGTANLNRKSKSLSETQLNQQQNVGRQKQFVTLPPQLIIAYRCKELQISDLDILDKSNVFCLGLLFLQVTTLLPSYECYDTQTCDILDQVIVQRIEMIKQYYSDQIASIVANMLDYDYMERMNLKQLSIFVNRQLNKQAITNQKSYKQFSNKKNTFIDQQTINSQQQIQQNNQSRITKSGFINKSRIQANQKSRIQPNQKSRISNNQKTNLQQPENDQSRISKPSFNSSISQKKKNKTNKVYMGGSVKQQEPEQTFTRQERNKVYMKNCNQNQSKRNMMDQGSNFNRRSSNILKQIHTPNNARSNNEESFRENKNNIRNFNNLSDKFKPSIPEYSIKPRNTYINNQQQDDLQNYHPSDFSKNLKRKNSTDYLGYRASIIKTPKQQNYHQQKSRFQNDSQNQFKECKKPKYNKQENSFGYIKREDKRQQSLRNKFCQKQQSLAEDSGSRGYFMNERNNYIPNHSMNDNQSNNPPSKFGIHQSKDQDHSLNRIKSQIQRSRKLIQQFKRGEKCQF